MNRRSFGQFVLGGLAALFGPKAKAQPDCVWVQTTYRCGHKHTFESPGVYDPAGLYFKDIQSNRLRVPSDDFGVFKSSEIYWDCPECRESAVSYRVIFTAGPPPDSTQRIRIRNVEHGETKTTRYTSYLLGKDALVS